LGGAVGPPVEVVVVGGVGSPDILDEDVGDESWQGVERPVDVRFNHDLFKVNN
jgi:hypothetical protein